MSQNSPFFTLFLPYTHGGWVVLWQIFLQGPGEPGSRGPAKKSATEPPSPMCVKQVVNRSSGNNKIKTSRKLSF